MKGELNTNDLRAGNHKAYEMLFMQWYVPLCNYACSILHNMEEAEEIVQSMFCGLWDNREKIEIHTSVKSYLYRIVHNNSLNRIQEMKIRERHHQHLSNTTNYTHDDTSDLARHNELSLRIEKAMENLPPRCREVFRLSRFEHLSYSEIAQKMDIANGTVEKQIMKALRTMRVELQDYLIFAVIFISLF